VLFILISSSIVSTLSTSFNTVHSIGSTHLVILGGLAELFAGSISMGLGAYLAALTDRKHYDVELERERRQVMNSADQEDQEMYKLFGEYGLGKEVVDPLARQLRADPEAWVKVC
jgi:vacuolar iron transporter family protein